MASMLSLAQAEEKKQVPGRYLSITFLGDGDLGQGLVTWTYDTGTGKIGPWKWVLGANQEDKFIKTFVLNIPKDAKPGKVGTYGLAVTRLGGRSPKRFVTLTNTSTGTVWRAEFTFRSLTENKVKWKKLELALPK